MENLPGTERKGSLSERQHMTGILVTSQLTQPRLPSLALSRLLLRSAPVSQSPLSSSPKKKPHPKKPNPQQQPLKELAVFRVKINKQIKKERTNYSPLGSAWPGCSQNKPVSALQQVSFSELKGSPRKQFLLFFSLRHFNGKVKNKWNESKPFGCRCFS